MTVSESPWWSVAIGAAAAGKHEVMVKNIADEDGNEVWECVTCGHVIVGSPEECEAQLDLHEASGMIEAAYPFLVEYARETDSLDRQEGVDPVWWDAELGDVWFAEIAASSDNVGAGARTVELVYTVPMTNDSGEQVCGFARATHAWLPVTSRRIVAARKVNIAGEKEREQ